MLTALEPQCLGFGTRVTLSCACLIAVHVVWARFPNEGWRRDGHARRRCDCGVGLCCRGKYDADDITKLEQTLNRVQRELGGQVGSFRLKGPRQRFNGRSSVVAFADGMWGGEFALKFYADADAAQTEFAIYRQATVRPSNAQTFSCAACNVCKLLAGVAAARIVSVQSSTGNRHT
jgi:hypothetical protein